ncbi:MAG TPA: tRNA 2-thiouridine(34) synthase MnmA [Candidatus Paceibacterota bacterium]|nr:tRNA 2-thiouridine(34) synthase MnmA [Candidatus Paceibacterota bacterium]
MLSVKGKRVFVGLSGGVDSAVTAALLQRAGAAVTGVFIKGAYPEGLPCSWAEDRRDALQVAARLGIPFLTFDASAAYQKAVIDYLIHEYAAGNTPNPDVMCNRDVKFGAFYDFAMAHGADFIATGHYAQIRSEGHTAAEQHVPSLLRGTDTSKDQSYFLWAIRKETLSRILFPLGGMEKSAVRALAKKFNLPNATKRDSQGVCFLGNVSIEQFLAQEVGLAPGPIVNASGVVLGEHHGAMAYTLGERVSLPDGPWYVLAKGLRTNTLTVAHTIDTTDAIPAVLTLRECNWLVTPEEGKSYDAQYRYHGTRIRGTFDAALHQFTPDEPLTMPIASGQSLVLYDGEQLIGGGIITA